jgi:hypothetical protein
MEVPYCDIVTYNFVYVINLTSSLPIENSLWLMSSSVYCNQIGLAVITLSGA